MRSPLLTKLSILLGRRPPVNWLLLCLISIFVLKILLGSSSLSAVDSEATAAKPDIYTSYRKLKEKARSDYLELKSLSLGANRIKDIEFCGKEKENYVPCYNVSANSLVGLKDGEEFDLHCELSREKPLCLVRSPKDYKIPLIWSFGVEM